jgi:glycosyltransferase involved in cell wall biosynthesis
VKRTALVLSYHNWNGKRYGGLHAIGESLVEAGWGVIFWSLPRTYWNSIWSRDEIMRWRTVRPLLNNIHKADNGLGLVNISIMSLEIPGERRLGAVSRLNERARKRVWDNFVNSEIAAKLDPDLIVLESCEAVHFYAPITKQFPRAKIVYRVSDPIAGWQFPTQSLVKAESSVMDKADLVLFCNEEQRALYAEKGNRPKGSFKVLQNGFDRNAYLKRHPKPSFYSEEGPYFCYLGALEPNWDIIINAATKLEGHFVIVCPTRPRPAIRRKLKRLNNILFIPGVRPSEVPPIISHCDVFIVPYPERIKRIRLVLHSKILQAMAANKPIVAINTGREIRRYGVLVAEKEEDFIEYCSAACAQAPRSYPLDLDEYSWTHFKNSFIGLIAQII